jgi:hypothetical protein
MKNCMWKCIKKVFWIPLGYEEHCLKVYLSFPNTIYECIILDAKSYGINMHRRVFDTNEWCYFGLIEVKNLLFEIFVLKLILIHIDIIPKDN